MTKLIMNGEIVEYFTIDMPSSTCDTPRIGNVDIFSDEDHLVQSCTFLEENMTTEIVNNKMVISIVLADEVFDGVVEGL